jgi:hypothetical protein
MTAARLIGAVLAGAGACSAVAAPGLYQLAPDAAAAPQAAPAWDVPRWADPARRARFDGQYLSCSAQSSGGRFGVAGVYAWRIDLAGGLNRRYGARLHLFDLRERRLVRVVTVSELARGGGGRSVAPLACAITADEAMLLVVSADRLAMYAVANGYLVDERALALAGTPVSLQLAGGVRPMVRVLAGGAATDFALEY